MSSIVSSLATASLVMHLIFGCCWHHGHTHGAERASVPSHGPAECHSTAACTHAAEHGPTLSSHGDSHEPGCGQRCALSIAKPVRVLSATAMLWEVAVSAVPQREPDVAMHARVIERGLATARPVGSIRPHLLLQILLI